VDENLDFFEADSEQVVLSGSVVLKEILHNLPPEDEARVLVLVRSANDSAKDVERYVERTHGFSQGPMQQERIREILEPLWNKRFPVTKICVRSAESALETSIDVRAEFVAFLKGLTGSSTSLTDSWSAIWVFCISSKEI
jgi:hypothetical protein